MADPTTADRKAFAKSGEAMPDGSYYIRNGPEAQSDLHNAIMAVGRATPNTDEQHNAVRRHIIKRAMDLGFSKMIPDNWDTDGSLKHSDELEAFLIHFGVKGMHWGVRKSRSTSSPGVHRVKVPANSSEDHLQVAAIKDKVKKNKGVHSLTNEELRVLTNRINLEQQYSRLVVEGKSDVDKGRRFVKTAVGDVKMTLDAIETGKRVYDQISGLSSATAKHGGHKVIQGQVVG